MSYLVLSLIGIFVAMLLLTVEIFLPTAGTIGILAFLVVVAAVVSAFLHSVVYGSIFLLLIVVATPFLFAAAVKIWPHTPIGRMILIGDIKKENVMPKDSHYLRIADQIGKTGIAKTKMYPSGIVMIDDQKFDALTTGFPIEAGETVKVISVKGNRLHVQKLEKDNQTGDDQTEDDQAGNDNSNQSPNELTKTMEDLGFDDFEL